MADERRSQRLSATLATLRQERLKLSPLVELPVEPKSNALDPEQALDRRRLVRAVHAAIAELDRSYREVLVLRDLEGLSGEEASHALGLPLSTLRRVRERFGRAGVDEQR